MNLKSTKAKNEANHIEALSIFMKAMNEAD